MDLLEKKSSEGSTLFS